MQRERERERVCVREFVIEKWEVNTARIIIISLESVAFGGPGFSSEQFHQMSLSLMTCEII